MRARRVAVLATLVLTVALCTRRGRRVIGSLLFQLGIELMFGDEGPDLRAHDARRRGRAQFDRDVLAARANGHLRNDDRQI